MNQGSETYTVYVTTSFHLYHKRHFPMENMYQGEENLHFDASFPFSLEDLQPLNSWRIWIKKFFTNSQNGWGCKAPLDIIWSNCPNQAGPPRADFTGLDWLGFYYLQGWKLFLLPHEDCIFCLPQIWMVSSASGLENFPLKNSPTLKNRSHSTKEYWYTRSMGNDPYPQILNFNLKQTNKQIIAIIMSMKMTFVECLNHSESGSDRRLSCVIENFMQPSGSNSITDAGTQKGKKERSHSATQCWPISKKGGGGGGENRKKKEEKSRK